MRSPKKFQAVNIALMALAAAVTAGLVLAAPASKDVPPAVVYSSGDLVRLVRKETLQFNKEPFLAAPKGQEFTVFKHEPGKGQVFLAFVQKEGGVIAVTLPEDALELVPPDGWMCVLRGAQAFREQRYDDVHKWLPKAAQDPAYKALAAGLQSRMDAMTGAARQVLQVEGDASLKAAPEVYAQKAQLVQKPFQEAVSAGRDMAAELSTRGFTSLSYSVEEGIDRLWARVLPKREGDAARLEMPPSKQSREELGAKASNSAFAVVRCRQAMAVKRMVEASNYIEEGLQAEPARPELKLMQTKVKQEIADAEDRFNAAQSNIKRNLPQALLALERGIKTCADLPQLLKLREELSGALEAKTAPPVTPAFLSAAKVSTPQNLLEEGRRLYTSRCNQCHDLEMLDSRSESGWKSEVSSMARRAKIDEKQQNIIVQYLTAARTVVLEGPRDKTN